MFPLACFLPSLFVGGRLEKITYPDARVVFYDYGTAGAIDDLLGRVKRIRETNSSGTILAEYSHQGLGSPVIVDYQQPDVKLDRFQGTSGTYAGLDRFGRVKDHYWDGYGTTADVSRIKHGYDYASNRTYRDLDSAIYAGNDKDQAYTYDDLDRLKTFNQGTLSGSTITGTPTREQDFTLDQLGNWSNLTEKTNGTTDLDQDRTHNKANELDTIDNWANPLHDAAGNMTTMPQPKSLASSYTAIYDAWNRLVEIKDGSTVVTYESDGLGRRITKVIGSVTRHFYYSTGSQVLEEREDSETNADIQYVWGMRYIDDLILRDRDADNNGTSLEERLYALQDANWNVVALTNSTGAVQQRFQYDPYGTAVNRPELLRGW